MALATDKPESVLAKELRDCQEKLDNMSESLKNERKLSEIKERTIQNLKQEIRIVDKDASERKREIGKLNEIVQHLRSKAIALETENKVLENQTKVVQDSNHRLNKQLLETRNTLRLRDTEAEEMKAQRANATRKYTHVLRTAIDKCTRFNCFLQQLESDFHSRDVSCKRLQAQRITIEDALKEQNLESKRYPEHGWYGLFPLRRHSHVLLDDEKENLKKDLEKVCSDNPSLSDDSVMNKLVQTVEVGMVDCLKSRLSVQDHAITEAQKKLRGVRAEVRELKNLEYEQVDSAKRMEEKVWTWKQLLEEELKELKNELSAAKTSQRGDEGNMKPTRKFSVGCDSRIRSLSVAKKTSREEILEIEKAISSLVSKAEVSNNPLSHMEERILSLKQKLTRLIEEKMALSDELIESQNSLINVETLLGNQTQENSTLNNQLSAKRKVLRETETTMQAALQGKMELERRLDAANEELHKRKQEAESYKAKLNECAHRVELNFTPRSQSAKELVPESPREHAVSEPQDSITSTEGLSHKDVAHKSVQVDRNAQHSVLSARKSSDRRRNSVEFPRERRLSKAELKLTFRCNKETQVDTMAEETFKVEAALDEARNGNKAMEKLNQELLSALERREKEIEQLTSHIKELQNRDLEEKSWKTGLCSDQPQQGKLNDKEKRSKEVQTEPDEHEGGTREKAADVLRNCRMDILDLQESLGNALMDSEVLRNQKDELKKELERKENEIMKLTEKGAAREWLEPGMESLAKQEKVLSIITQMEEKIQLEAEKDNEYFGQKFSDQQDIMLKMRKKIQYLEKRNNEVETELEDQRKLISSLRVQRVDLQGLVSNQDEATLDERSIFKEEILELQHSVKNTILQKEDVENKLQDLRDELQRRASTLEAQENEWYKAQTSHLQKQIEQTLEEKDAVEREIEDLQTEIYRRRISRITAEVNEFERKHSLSYPEGTNTRKMITDLKDAIEKAQEHEQKAKLRVRELERELADKRELINTYLSEEQISPQDSQLNYLFGGTSREKGNDDDRKLRQEFRLLNQEIGTLRRRVEIRERNLETKVKELAHKEFLIQKVIHEKNREMEEMEIKFKCRLQEQLEKLHKELTDGKDFFNEAAKEENWTLKDRLTKLHAHIKSNERTERELGLSQQKCKSLENAVDALERQKSDLNYEREDLKRQTVELNFHLKINQEKVNQAAENLSLAEKKCEHLDTTLETFRRSELELKTKLQSLVDENSRLESKLERAAEVERELAESKEKCRALEESVLNFREELSALEDQAIESQRQSTCLKREKFSRDEEISHLEKKLHSVLTERDSIISDKDAAADLLQRKVEEMEKMALDTKRAQQQDQEKLREVRNKLQEVEMKYAVVKEENQKLEKELKSGTEKMFQLQKNLSDAQAEVKTQAERIKSLNTQNSRLKDASNEKDESLRREERLRMENMKTLDALKIKLEKSESGDKRQRERLFSLKSACSEANEAYEIVKKQNMELRNDMKELKKKLDEQEAALESSQKEKETLEEHILNASRSIDELKKFSRCERVSPDSALGISIASYASDLSSGPNSPNSDIRDDMSDSAFLTEAAYEKYGTEQGDLLCKMPNMIENFRAIVLESETIRNRLGALLVSKEKADSQILEYSQVNTSLRKDVEQKDKRLATLESKIKLLDDDLLDTDSKVGDLEKCLTESTSELELTQKRLADRQAAIEDLKEKMDLLEEREKALELYSKSVSEKYKYEQSEKKKLEDINTQLQGEVEEHKKRIGAIEKKLSRPNRDTGLLTISYPDTTDGVSMEMAESKLDAMLTQLSVLETSLSTVQSENIGLERENEDLQYANDELRKYESLSKELEEKIQDLQVRDEVATAKITQLENQNEMLEEQNKENEEAIEEYKQNDEELEEKVKLTEYSVRALERANETYRDETERLREDLRQAEESCSKQDIELSSAMTKLSELEITNEAYKSENGKLQQDLKALSEAKCEVEYRISEAERQERKLNEAIEQEKTYNIEAEKKRQEIQEHCEDLYQEKKKFKESVTALEEKLERVQHDKDQLEKEAVNLSSENSKLSDQLSQVTKDLSELEEKLKNSTVQREKLEQQLSITGLETSKLTSAYETSMRRKNATEKNLIDANGKNEELQVCLERAREEKASLLKDASHKEEQIQQLESQRDELKDDKQKLLNDVYFGTRKVLALQQELETLRGDANLLGKELRGIIQGSLSKERFSEESDTKDGDDDSDRSYETAPQTLRQNIRVTERALEAIRHEARITDLESKSCQRDVEGIRKEFSHLKEQLRIYKQQSQKLADEVKRMREELATRQSHLLETKERYETLKEENLETRETVSQLQNKGAELEALLTEYENKAETSHTELMRANQHIASLEANLTRTDQKKISQEKELLVANEKISNLEANARAMKDDGRNDKRKIASLEVEYSEKQALARELEKTDAALTDLRFKYGDLLKEKEEVKTELASLREESKQEQLELKSTRKEAENLKRTVSTEKDLCAKTQQDLTGKTEQCETYKKNLKNVERSLGKLQSDNACLEEKVKLLEDAGTTLNRETEIQNVETRRLQDVLQDMKNNLKNVSNNYEGCEKERKRLKEELMKAEENVSKLQGTCDELLKEKEGSSFKLTSLNEALELAICNREEIEISLKQDLMLTKKELSVTSSTLERSQKKVDELLQETRNNELKIKSLEEKKQDALDKYWAGLEELTEAEAKIDNLRTEGNELKGKCAADALKIQLLQETLDEEREENEKEIASCNEKMSKLKNLHQKVTEERDYLKENLEDTRGSLAKVNEELQQTSGTLTKRERCFKDEVISRDEVIEDLANQNTYMKEELAKTKSALKEASSDNSDLRERFYITTDKVESLEKTLDERNNEIEDLLVEAHAKLNVVQKMKVFNSGESFAELPAMSIVEDETDGLDHAHTTHNNPRKTTIKEVLTSYHRACLLSLNDCRSLQEKLCQTKQDSDRLEDNLQKERAETAEIKKCLQEVQKKRTKSEEDVKRLRRRLESFKVKSIEVAKERDNEITEVKGDKIALEKDLWEAKESLEQVKARLTSTDEEKDRYAKDLDSSRKAVVDAKNEIKSAQGQLDFLQENMLQLKKRIFELEATEKFGKQQLQQKERELHATQLKVQELEKLKDDSNKKKTELYQEVAKAEEKIGCLESDYHDKTAQNAALESKVTTMKSAINELEKNLEKVRTDLQASRKECDGLEIHRASLQASNDALTQQVEVSRNKSNALNRSLGKTQEENAGLRKELGQTRCTKENLENENKALLEEKQAAKKELHSSDTSLRYAEDKLVKSFQENESLKRQNIKTQSSACADLAQKQLEMGKLKAEACSLKQELIEKNKALNDALTKSKVTEKENEFLKKELGDIHHQKSDLKLDLNATTSKLQSYLMERECWEREVKNVLTEIDKQKNANHSKEQRLERMRARYEQEVKFLQQRVEVQEREMRVLHEGYEQQRHTDEIAYKLAMESKDMEIDNLKLRLQTTRLHANDKSNVLDVMKGQLDQRSAKIQELTEQIKCLKESYQLEVASLQAELRGAHAENLLHTRGDTSYDKSASDNVGELLDEIQSSRKESDRLRRMLGSKMTEMKSLNNHVTSERASGSRHAGHLAQPYSYSKSPRRAGLTSTE